MSETLFINACLRSESRTLELAKCVLDKLGGKIKEIKLYNTELFPLDLKGLKNRDEALKNGDFSDDYFSLAKQFSKAETIVIAAPYWDLMFPAVLKTYLENISVSGITFDYSDEGVPVGLCKAENLYYVTTAGGYIGENNFGFTYIKALVTQLFGIKNVKCFSAEGLDFSPENAYDLLNKVKENIDISPENRHTISYPENYGEEPSLNGASAFAKTTDHPQSRYYVNNDFFNMKSDNTLHILSNFKTYQQTTEYTCGAASALMVLNWFGEEKYHEKAVAGLIETHSTKGSSVENIADLFDLIGWNVDCHASTECRFNTIDEAEGKIIEYIDNGIPIMVDWVDWAGHWQVLIGIDTCGTDTPYDDVLIFADPYDVTDHNQDGYYTYPLGRFFGMWREGPCAEKDTPYKQPFVAVWPENKK